jgi:hypothetical protein
MNKARVLELAARMVSLFHSGEVGQAVRNGTLLGEEEGFGALRFATRQFKRGYKLYEELREEVSK